MGVPGRTVEAILRHFADSQHGLVTRAQLLAAGVSARAIERRLQKGTLVPEYRGIYRVGHRAPSVEASYLAAVLACGHGALLCGRAAELARACHEAGVRHRTSPAQVDAVLARRPNSPGAAELRRVLRGEVHVTVSKLERRFLELLRANGLVLPQTNRPAGGRRVDCRWPEQRLTVELDSYRYHRSRHAWEQDRRREREAHARGDAFRRYTYGDVFERPRLMLRELRELLPRRRPV